MKIPKQFTIHCHQIKVIQKEIDLEGNRYGYYDSVREEIVLFNKIKVDGETVSLNQTQLESTFWHELIHSFQWHIKGETDEWEAQSYAGLMMEFISTSGIRIDPNVVHEAVMTKFDD